MSMEIFVFLERSNIPTVGEWQAELDRLATSVVLNPEFNPSQNRGFVPAKYKDVESGFEFLLVDTNSLVDSYYQLENQVEQFDTAAVFTYGGNLAECAAANSAAASLSALAPGLFYDPQDDMLISGEESKLHARSVVAEIEKMSKP